MKLKYLSLHIVDPKKEIHHQNQINDIPVRSSIGQFLPISTVGAESLFRMKSLCRGTFAIDLRPLKCHMSSIFVPVHIQTL